jgi:hypothetical protein
MGGECGGGTEGGERRSFDPGHFHGKFIKDPEGPATWRCWCCEEIGYLLDSLLPHPLCERGLRPAIWKVIIPSLCENREISARSLKLPHLKASFFLFFELECKETPLPS